MPRECPQCHALTEIGALYCGNCGKQLAVVAATTAVAPAYALATPLTHRGELRAMASIVLGCVGVVTIIMPPISILLGVTGIVLGTLTHQRYRHMSTIGITVSTVAVLAALGVWVLALGG